MRKPDDHMLNDRMMTSDGCNERYAELCALSTTGALSEQESHELRIHLTNCPQCTRLMADYEAFVSVDMAKIGAALVDPAECITGVPLWSRSKVKQKLLAEVAKPAGSGGPLHWCPIPWPANSQQWLKVFRVSAAAASLPVIIWLSYEMVTQRASIQSGPPHTEADVQSVQSSTSRTSSNSAGVASLRAELDALEAQLKESNRLIQEYESQAESDQKQIAELQAQKTSLEGSVIQLRQENTSQAEALGSLFTEKINLQQQLEQTQKVLQNLEYNLEKTKQDREHGLLRAASLETEVNSLNERLSLLESDIQQKEQFLAVDRDIRELMGARELYIADVLDVNKDGKRSKAFGRVFYTKGKSLVFYAFDLDQQTEHHDARAFQAWGRSDAVHSGPVSLGIFYRDSEGKRRWILKADNPDVLAQISAVFVTVEPPGGNKKPSGKPFLFAYLRSLPPNHP